jgi:hypothetical protein
MNKKLLTFGILGVLALTLVSAILVNYLSNTAEVQVEVNSPMNVQFSQGEEYTENLVLEDTTGLSTIEFNMKVTNNANNDISEPEIDVTFKDDGVNVKCEDFQTIYFTDTMCGEEDCPEQDLMEMDVCEDKGGEVVFKIPTNIYLAGEVSVYPIEVTFANIQPANYEITAQMVIPEEHGNGGGQGGGHGGH